MAKVTAAQAREVIQALRDGRHYESSVQNRLYLSPWSLAAAKVFVENIDVLVHARSEQLTAGQIRSEQAFCRHHLEFLVRLQNLHVAEQTAREGEGLRARIALAAHIFSSDRGRSAVTISDLREYRAHTVFNFGDRQFDRIFECGDGDQVRDALEQMAELDPVVAESCRAMGWLASSGERSAHRERG